jgi:hypothetical protein
MNINRSKRQDGISLPTVILILCIIIVAVLIFRPLIASLFSPKPTKISVHTYIDHTSRFFHTDQYYMMIVISHLEDNPLKGGLILIVKGPGHVRPFEAEKQKNGQVIDDHTVRFMVSDWQPGEANSQYFYFDLDSPELNENGLSSEEVQKRILVRIEAMFFKPGDTIDTASSCNFTVGQ